MVHCNTWSIATLGLQRLDCNAWIATLGKLLYPQADMIDRHVVALARIEVMPAGVCFCRSRIDM
ncbi:hypothetical protein V4R08_00785 [Nitrobacter sp. NHB1]|uniref:hypothetical protein n=1 Tax=Nitrobacter sp. NHB1 TaxID=3119830 RepID=UPI002FFD70E6